MNAMLSSDATLQGQIGTNVGVGALMEAGLVDGRIGVPKPVAPDMSRETSASSIASDASASSMFSASSTSSATSAATSVSTSSVTKTSSSSSSAFSSSQFRQSSQHLLIQDTCTKLELKGTYLHVECLRLDGSITQSNIDLDGIIGFIDGRLEWDMTGFSKYCFDYSLDGFFLVVKYRLREGADIQIARIDLRTRLRNANGVLIIIELNKKLSVMLSEVPWMKFKVIAEPDLNIFAKHPVMQETLTRIAETTVEHVTIEMHKKLTIAMEAAISAVTLSAMSHVSSQMETLVQNAVGYASASPAITAAESLQLYGPGRGGVYYGGAGSLVYGGGAGQIIGGGGSITGGGTISGGISGSVSGGIIAGGGVIANGVGQVTSGEVSGSISGGITTGAGVVGGVGQAISSEVSGSISGGISTGAGVIAGGVGQAISGGISGGLSGGGGIGVGGGAGYFNTQRQEEQSITKDERSSSYSEVQKDSQFSQGQFVQQGQFAQGQYVQGQYPQGQFIRNQTPGI